MKNNKLQLFSYDLIFLGIGLVVMSIFGLVMLSNSSLNQLEDAAAQSIPNSPGGGAIELPTSNSDDSDDSGSLPRTSTGVDQATDVPVPEDPVIEIEEIDEVGNTVETDPVFNLNNDIDTTNPIAIDSQSGVPTSNNTPESTNTTVRSGGEAVILTLLGAGLVIAGVVYYTKRGNRKSKLKLKEKKIK